MEGLGFVYLDRSLKRSLQAQLADQVKAVIQTGKIRAGQKLPSTRVLADQLQVSRNTVVAAYESLYGEGYLQVNERSAFVVGSATQAFRSRPQQPSLNQKKYRSPLEPIMPAPFRPAQPDVNLFPLKIWNRYRTRVLRKGSSLLQYQSRFSIGLDELRKNVAGYLRDSRGVRCNWDEIAITGGSQQALFLLGHLLLGRDRSVYMEDPGYLGARRSSLVAGAAVVPVSIDEEGICLPLPPAENPSLIYVTPSHQFPLGTCMSLARRLDLLEIARQQQLWIIEDDYDAEFRYTSAPQPCLQGLDEHQRVIYMGSFSKTLFPSLRLGFIVLPPELVDPFTELKTILDDLSPLIDQATLSYFLESGAFYAHLRRCRRVYAERQAYFLDLVRRKGLPLSFPITGRGMNLAGRLPQGFDDRVLSQRLQATGLDIPSLSTYGIDAKLPGFLFGLTAFDKPEIHRGVEGLARVLAHQ